MAGSWQPLPHQPKFNADTMLLLTDGSVFCHEYLSSNWHRLAPDSSGKYDSTDWVPIAPLPNNPIIPPASGGPTNTPLYFASALLDDGSVFVAGGEYNADHADADILAAQVYDPKADAWHIVDPPPDWTAIGDAPSCVLRDGRLLLGSIRTTSTTVFDRATGSWSVGPSKDEVSSEETWTLLPDGCVLTVECTRHPLTEKCLPDLSSWVSAGATPADLVEAASIEIGPAILLPDGRVFAIGATGATCLYLPPGAPNLPGTWLGGPRLPIQDGQQLIAKDAAACLLPNGRVLLTASPAAGCDSSLGGYCPPTYFFEFDPGAPAALFPAPRPANSDGPAYTGRMLLLPTGQVLYANNSNHVEVYTPDGAPADSWRPRVTSCPSHVKAGGGFTLFGQQLNGLSQAVSYGDDAQMATNYPLVRIINTASRHVAYCRTSNHSTMGVATGDAVHSTDVAVPIGTETGPSELIVVANGIDSASASITID